MGCLLVIALLTFGAYGALRYGEWTTVTVVDALLWLGVEAIQLIFTTEWAGIRNAWYWWLDTNLIWTVVLAVPLIEFPLWLVIGSLSKHDDLHDKTP